ncbi:MAG: hypothetical protein ACRDXB_19625 [Actinomycetes bacterium]
MSTENCNRKMEKNMTQETPQTPPDMINVPVPADTPPPEAIAVTPENAQQMDADKK